MCHLPLFTVASQDRISVSVSISIKAAVAVVNFHIIASHPSSTGNVKGFLLQHFLLMPRCCRLLVGAPLADDTNPAQRGVTRGGSVFRCNAQQQQLNGGNESDKACEPIPFDLSGTKLIYCCCYLINNNYI